jgi:hypothetical protein
MDNNNREHKKEYHEFINFAIQGMSENAQFSLAIAVGIFGILAIFVTIRSVFEKCFVDTTPMDLEHWNSTLNCLLRSSSLWNPNLR